MTDFHNKSPIYLQLMAEIKQKILAGIMAPGEKLPSVRDLAMDEGVNAALIRTVRQEFARNSTNDYLDRMEEIGYEEQEIPDLVVKIQKERMQQ